MARTPQEIEQEKNKRKNEQMQKLLRAEQQKKTSKPKVSQQKKIEQKQPRRDTIPVLRQNTSVLQPSDLTGWNTARAVTPDQVEQLPQLPTISSWINGLDQKNTHALSQRGVADNSPEKSAWIAEYLSKVPELKSAYQNVSNSLQTIPVLQPMNSYARDAEISRGELNKLFKQSEQADAKIAELGKIPNGKRQGYAKQEIAKAKNERSDIHDKANIASYSNKRANTMLNIQKTPGLEDALSAFRNSVRQTGDIDTSIPEGVELANARVAARNEILQKYNLDIDRFNEMYADYDEAKTIEENQATEQKAMEFGQEHPVAATGVGLALSPVTALSGLGSQVEGWQNPRPMSEYSDIFLPNILQSGMRSGAAENIDSELGQFAYGAGNSIADVVLNGLIAKGAGSAAVGGALTGARVSGDSMQDALSRGASNKQAAATGLASGAAEGIGETLSLGSILKPTTATGFKNVAKNLGKSALVEGSEEGVTNIVNTAFDSMINGQNSAFNTNVANYRAQGMSEDAAVKQASSDYFKQLLTDMAAGGIAGGALGGINMAMSGSKLRNKVPVLEQIESKKYIDPAEKALSDTNVAETHTTEEIQSMNEYVNASDESIKTFVQTIKDNPQAKVNPLVLSRVSERAANDIKRLTGVDALNNSIVLDKNDIIHIYKKHGENGTTDRSMADDDSLSRINYIINNYDNAYLGKRSSATRLSNGSKAPTVVFVKKIDGQYYVIEAVTDASSKTNRIVSAFIGDVDSIERNIQKGSITQISNAQSALEKTPISGVESTSFDNSIPNSAQNVNTTMSERVNPANTYIEVLPHANDYANNVMDTVDGYVKLYGDDNSKAMAAEARGKIDTFFENPTEQNMQEWFDAILKVNSSLQGKKNFNKRFKSTQVYRDEIMDTFSEDGSRIFGRTIEDIDPVGDYSASTTMNESVDSNNAEMTIPVLKQTKSAKENAMQIPPGMRERGYAESIRTKTDLPDEVKQEFIDSPELYQQLSNSDTKAKSDSILQNNDLDGAVSQFNRLLTLKDAAAVPLGYDISKQMIASGRTDEAVELLRNMSRELTKGGQFTQAAAITMMQNDPTTALRYITRDIDNMNVKGREKFKDKWKDFTLTEDEINAFNDISQGDNQAISDLYNHIGNRIAKEYPATKWEKFVELTKMSMLLNPRTHFRNVVSNTLLMPIRSATDRVSALGQNVVHLINPDVAITQSLTGSIGGKYKKSASDIWDSVKDSIVGDSKYNENMNSGIAKNKTVFKGNGLTEKLLGGKLEKINSMMGKDVNNSVLETLRNADYYLLGEIEDNPFVKANFVNRLASYMKAQGITDAGSVPTEAISLATDEALKATFKDDNWITKMLSNVKRDTGKFGEVLLPFTKTPANLAKRGLDYSPVGLIETFKNARNGTDVAKTMDDLSKNLVGTAAIAAGYILAKNGFIRGALSDDKDEEQFQKQQGKLPFSINVNGNDYTYDWAQPAAIPFIIGAVINDAITRSDDEDSTLLKTIGTGAKNAGLAAADSWLELSPLQSLQDIFGGGYGSSTAENVLNEIAEFPQRLIPSLSGAIARTVDPVQRQTFSNDNLLKTQLDTAKSKIPFLSESLPVAYDTWGNPKTRSDSRGEAAFAQFVNPGQLGNDNSTKIDQEITRLYDSVGEKGVFPHKADWSVDKKKLNNEEYSAYQKEMGTKAYEFDSAFIDSAVYRDMEDAERADTISRMNGLAKAMANNTQFGKEVSALYAKAYEAYQEGGVDGLIDYHYQRVLADRYGVSSKMVEKLQGDETAIADYANKKNTAEKYDVSQSVVDMGFVDKEGNANLDAYQKAQNAFGGDSRYIQQYANLDSKAQAQYGKSFSGAKLEQKIPMLEGMNISNAEKGKYLAAASGDMGKKATAVYNQYGPEGYYLYYLGKSNKDDMDYNGNGKVTKDERESYFRQMGLANEMAAFLAKQGF